MARRVSKEYPRIVYGPYGASMTITLPSEWPEGWSADPIVDIGAPVVPRMGTIPLPRGEMKRKLREANVAFRESDSNSALWALVQERIK